MALLEIRNVHGGYGENTVLNGVNMTVNEKEIIAIIGPNGSGKSTAMRAVMGMISVYSGQIIYDNQDITNLTTNQIVQIGISYVPQVANVFTDMSVRDNLLMGGFLNANNVQTLQNVFDLFPDLAEKSKTLAGNLSGGQRQMLAVGRALMLTPKLLLVDEPTAGLSPKYMTKMFEILHTIQKQGIAILLVEQHAKQALKYGDRGYILTLGKNVHEGKSDYLLNDPKILQVFLGG